MIVRIRRRILGAVGFYAARDVLRLRAFRRECRRRGTRIHRRARLYGINRITIGKNAFIDAGVILSTTAPYSGSGLIESRGEIVLGDRCVVLSGCVVACFGGSVRFGDDVTVNTHTVLLATGGITIGSKTKIAPHVTIVGETHRFASADIPIMEQGMAGRGVHIGSDVWIGAGAKILDGVTVADGAVVGAGAVVTRSVDAYSVVAGVPARRIGARTRGESPSPGVLEEAPDVETAPKGTAHTSRTA